MVLHDVTDDAKLVEVASSALGAEGFLEGDRDVSDVVPVPDRLERGISKPAKKNGDWQTSKTQ